MKNYYLDRVKRRTWPQSLLDVLFICNNPGCGNNIEVGEHMVCRSCREKLNEVLPDWAKPSSDFVDLSTVMNSDAYHRGSWKDHMNRIEEIEEAMNNFNPDL